MCSLLTIDIVLLLASNLLIAPSLLLWWLLMLSRRSATGRLHQQGRARIRDRLSESVVSAPLFHGTCFDLKALSVDIRQDHELLLGHLHVKVDFRCTLRVVAWQDNLQRIAR